MESYIVRETEIKFKTKRKKSVFFNSPKEVYGWFKDLGNEDREKVITCYLTTGNEVIAFSADFQGGYNSCTLDPRVIFRNAIALGAARIIVIHNHPAGQLIFSEEDKKIIKTVKKGGKILNIELVDAIIIIAGNYASAQEKGII